MDVCWRTHTSLDLIFAGPESTVTKVDTPLGDESEPKYEVGGCSTIKQKKIMSTNSIQLFTVIEWDNTEHQQL